MEYSWIGCYVDMMARYMDKKYFLVNIISYRAANNFCLL